MVRSLQRLLRPKSIAVIGGKEAAAVVEQCISIGFKGNIWPVHPTKNEVFGYKTYSSIELLPSAPDAAYVAVNRQRTIPIVQALQKLGCGGVISYASGFLESGEEGAGLQDALIKAAGDMPLIGPNCYGLLNFADGVALWPDQHGGQRLDDGQSGVAIITQSSNIAISMTMQQRGLPLAYMMTVGNQAQSGLSVMALNLLDDPRVTALGLHIEAFDSIPGFEEIARKARALKKPVIALKIGRSVEAKEASFTHTAAMAGSDAGADAFLKRIGISRMNSISAFLEALKLLHVCGPLDGNEISSMSCSGGEAGLMADAAFGRNIKYRKLTDEQKIPIQQALGPMVTIDNPLDYHTYIWGDRAGIEATFSGMLSARFNLNCLVLDFPRGDRCDDKDWWTPVGALEIASKRYNTRSAIIATMAENLGEEQARDLINRGIAPLCGVSEAMDAIEAAIEIGKAWRRKTAMPLMIEPSTLRSSETVLDEAAAKSLFSNHNIPVPNGARATSPEEAALMAEKIGCPVALKLLGFAHKSEHGAVQLGLEDKGQVLQAATNMQIPNHQFYVEAMVIKPVFELLIGIVHDEQFGLIMTIATGGTMVEVFNDGQTFLLPSGKQDIETTLRQLKSAVFYDGFRGGNKADFNASVDAILAIMEFALSNKSRLIELEINPLIVCELGKGAFAADALLKMRSTKNE